MPPVTNICGLVAPVLDVSVTIVSAGGLDRGRDLKLAMLWFYHCNSVTASAVKMMEAFQFSDCLWPLFFSLWVQR